MSAMQYDSKTHRLSGTAGLIRMTLITGIIALAVSAIGLVTDPAQFYHSYLVAFLFWFTVAIGGLFFTLLHNLTGSAWSVVLRRIGETIALITPALLVLFLPILLGLGYLYHWSDPAVVAHDAILLKKAAYLNAGFFSIRAVLYFAVWLVLGALIYRKSLEQDTTKDPAISKRLQQISAPGMILFALTITFASFDWIMSLDAHWYSTMFGVYIFSGSYLALLAFLTLLISAFHRLGLFQDVFTRQHLADLGKLLFAFTIFWAYIGAAQYFLIWYGNIPEETIWFLHRWEGSWRILSLALILFHFAVPFLILVFQAAKRNRVLLPTAALLLFVMHYFDMYWLVLPNLHHHNVHFSWMDLTTWIGIGSLFLALFFWLLTRNPVLPAGDPRLEESIHFEGH